MNKDNYRVYGFLSVSENVNDSENQNCYPLGWILSQMLINAGLGCLLCQKKRFSTGVQGDVLYKF